MWIEDKKLYRNIRIFTVILTCIVSLISVCILQKLDKAVFIGIWIGACCGLIGFQSIIFRISCLPHDPNKSKAYLQRSYIRRFFLYGIIFFISAYYGIHILAILFGMICHKLSIVCCVMMIKKGGYM